MNRALTTILLNLLVFSFCNGQIKIDFTRYDFGEINQEKAHYIDLFLKNTGTKTQFVLRIEKENNLRYIIQRKLIKQDSTTIIRFYPNPKKKGRFDIKANLYLSDRNEPVAIKFTGKYTPIERNQNNALTACPNFSTAKPKSNPFNFKYEIQVINNVTKELIPKAAVKCYYNGYLLNEYLSSKKRKQKQGKIGYYYVQARKEGFTNDEYGTYLSTRNNIIRLYLNPIYKPEITKDKIVNTPIKEASNKRVTTQATDTLFKTKEGELFNNKDYYPVNLVFVVDVSASMRQDGRIDLLKIAMYKLINALRESDQVALVKFTSEAEVLINSTKGKNKSTLNEAISNLKAGGYTSGSKGIKKGFMMVQKSYYKEGVNHVIVINDGHLVKTIKKYTKKNIQLSVVGIKNPKAADASIKEIAALGKGTYVSITNLSDATTKLNQTIRAISKK